MATSLPVMDCGGGEGADMIIIPSEEVDDFLANESGMQFNEEQLAFFRKAKKNYREMVKVKI